ncbi:MAG: type II toxin-antitoxin system HicB family antitoxin [Fimbriimonadales bacterium]
MESRLTIIFEKGENGWWIAEIPEIPGAFSQGATKEEARANVLDAMRELMEFRRQEAVDNVDQANVETIQLAS